MGKQFRIVAVFLIIFQLNLFCACRKSVIEQPPPVVDNGGNTNDGLKENENKIPLTGEWIPQVNPIGDTEEIPTQQIRTQAFVYTNYRALYTSLCLGSASNKYLTETTKVLFWGAERFEAFCSSVSNGDKKILIPYYKEYSYPYSESRYTPVVALWLNGYAMAEDNDITVKYSCNYRGRYVMIVLEYDVRYILSRGVELWSSIKEYLAYKYPDEKYGEENFRTIKLYGGSEVVAWYADVGYAASYTWIQDDIIVRIEIKQECDTEEFWSTLSFRACTDEPLN